MPIRKFPIIFNSTGNYDFLFPALPPIHCSTELLWGALQDLKPDQEYIFARVTWRSMWKISRCRCRTAQNFGFPYDSSDSSLSELPQGNPNPKLISQSSDTRINFINFFFFSLFIFLPCWGMSAGSLISSGAGTGPKTPFVTAKIMFSVVQHSLGAEMATGLQDLGTAGDFAPAQRASLAHDMWPQHVLPWEAPGPKSHNTSVSHPGQALGFSGFALPLRFGHLLWDKRLCSLQEGPEPVCGAQLPFKWYLS